ncbi:MAG: DUF928 domain-containing protein [Rhizonema sp. NSF051]|nr:DUF928 domain-containing protein [Rhizonema sp. NSF051]
MKLVVIDPKNVLAQIQSHRDYDQNMQLGYNAVKQRKYPVALSYFKQALLARGDDRYAKVAVKNIESYIARDQKPGATRRSYFIYIPDLGQPMRLVPAGTRGALRRSTAETALGGASENTARMSDQLNRSNSMVQTVVRGRHIQLGAAQGQACTQGNPPVTALTPFKNESQITTVEHPTLFFYIPQNSARALLVVQDENSQTIYKQNFPLQGLSGIVNLSVRRSTVPEQKIDKTYHWSLSVACVRTNSSQDFVLQGSIQRIDPDRELKKKLAAVDVRERAAIYAMSGLFQDSLTTLAQLRREHPNDNDLKTDWEDLLRTAGLEEIAQAPLAECCK